MKRVLMQGKLEKVRLASLIQAFLSDGVEGTLEVELGGRSGWLTLRTQSLGDGALGRLEGSDAAIGLMMPGTGSFVLREELHSSAQRIPEDPLGLMLEALRLFDVWAVVARRPLNGLRATPGTSSESITLQALLDQGQTPEQAAQTLTLHPLEVLRLMGPFLATLPGLAESPAANPSSPTPAHAWEDLEPTQQTAPGPDAPHSPAPLVTTLSELELAAWSPPEPAPTAQTFFELLDAARLAFREGQMQTAESLFLRAQALEPHNRTLQQNLRVFYLKQRLLAEEAAVAQRSSSPGRL